MNPFGLKASGWFRIVLFTAMLVPGSSLLAEDAPLDPSVPRQITGCLRRHYFLNAYDLHNGKDKIKVVGPKLLTGYVGKLVTVTGTWRNYGSFGGNAPEKSDPFFAATDVQVVAERCPAPPPDVAPRPRPE